jgi:putative ABC transport system permease protein
MRHHKGASSLLVLEIAFGFVIMVHAIIAARYYGSIAAVDTGMPVDDIVMVHERFLRPRDIEAGRARGRADLAALARLDGTNSAAVDTAPLPDVVTFPATLADAGHGAQLAWPLHATRGVTDALGLKIVAGHGLAGASVSPDGAPPVLLTRVLAADLYGSVAGAVGQHVEGGGGVRGRVVGVVENFTFRGTWVPNPAAVVIIEDEPASEQGLVYVVRGSSSGRGATLERVRQALGTPPGTVVSVRPLTSNRSRFWQISHGAVIVLSWTGFLVLAVAMAGSLALSSFSVSERTRQIGVRRALGARRSEIIGYFLLEKLILTLLGLLLGLGLAAVLNYALRQIMVDIVPTTGPFVVSAAVFLLTGLLSAVVPARRAAAIPPWAATKTL